MYNSAESEPIWMKSGTLRVHCLGLALTDFGRDPTRYGFTVGFVECVAGGSNTPSSFVGLARQWFRDPGLSGVRHGVEARKSGGKSTTTRAQFSSLDVGVPHEAVVHRHAHCHNGNTLLLTYFLAIVSVTSIHSQGADLRHTSVQASVSPVGLGLQPGEVLSFCLSGKQRTILPTSGRQNFTKFEHYT